MLQNLVCIQQSFSGSKNCRAQISSLFQESIPSEVDRGDHVVNSGGSRIPHRGTQPLRQPVPLPEALASANLCQKTCYNELLHFWLSNICICILPLSLVFFNFLSSHLCGYHTSSGSGGGAGARAPPGLQI